MTVCFWYLVSDSSSVRIRTVAYTRQVIIYKVPAKHCHVYLVRLYSVMQSDRNSFCGDVVLDSFYMAYRDEGRILCENMKSKSSGIYIVKIFDFKTDW